MVLIFCLLRSFLFLLSINVSSRRTRKNPISSDSSFVLAGTTTIPRQNAPGLQRHFQKNLRPKAFNAGIDRQKRVSIVAI